MYFQGFKIVLCGLLSLLSLSSQAISATTPTSLPQLEAAIDKIREQYQLPSVAYTLVNKDEVQLLSVKGQANIENNIIATADTRYRLGSVSKMFVSVAILQLVEQNQLRLEDPIRTLVPNIEFDNPWQQESPVKVVHLLEHTSGWDELSLREFAAKNSPSQTLQQSLDMFPDSRTSRWVPGSRHAYTNSGAAVAAQIVEKVSGQSFEDYVDEHIFAPLSMRSASYFQDPTLNSGTTSDNATAYNRLNTALAYKHLLYRPAGAVNASLSDMAKFTQMLLNQGAPVLSASSIARMERSESTNAGESTVAYGLNNSATPYQHWVYRGHDGAVNGAQGLLQYLPEAGVGFVVLINSSNQQALNKIANTIKAYQTASLDTPALAHQTHYDAKSGTLDGFYYVINPRIQSSHFFNRLLAIYKVTTKQQGLNIKGILPGATTEHFTAATGQRFLSPQHGKSGIILTEDPLAGKVLHYGDKVLKPISSTAVYGQFAVAFMWLLVIISSILFAPVWAIRKWRGKIPPGDAISMRMWPLFASLAVIVFMLMLALGMAEPYKNLGNIGPHSLGIMLTTITFAICALMGGYRLFRIQRQNVNAMAYWYCFVSITMHILVAGYLAWFGVIGWRTWL